MSVHKNNVWRTFDTDKTGLKTNRECMPVASDAIVDVRLRNGRVVTSRQAYLLMWIDLEDRSIAAWRHSEEPGNER